MRLQRIKNNLVCSGETVLGSLSTYERQKKSGPVFMEMHFFIHPSINNGTALSLAPAVCQALL